MKVSSELLARVTEWLRREKRNYINGQWVAGEGTLVTLYNPATEEVLCRYAGVSEKQLDFAVDAASEEFSKFTWGRLAPRERANLLRRMGEIVRRNAEELALIETLQNGKTFNESLFDDLPDSADVFDYYAGWTDKYYGELGPIGYGSLNYIVREPLGVCALIVPWNFPLYLTTQKVAPALAANNAIVVKPSSYTPLSFIRFMELLDAEVKLPPGLINMVLGAGRVVGDALTASPKVAKISFTGSTDVGRRIMEQSGKHHLRPLSLELGGKSPCIFFADAPNLDAAIDRAYHVMFSQKGEKCTEPTRFIIHESIYKKVAQRLVEKATAYRLGNPLEEETQQGAQCHRQHFESVVGYLEEAGRIGLKKLCGGLPEKKGNLAKGFFVLPTIYDDVDPDCRLAQEEIFGPLLCLFPFKTDAEAVELANNSSYGLAAGLYTANISRAHAVARDLQAGQIFVNKYGQYDFVAPFGGTKQSGLGRELGIHSMDAYTQVKSVLIAL
jgi:acyl-CoA reductase-like NAD-dependent aldehyde dehydrogenase